MQKSLIPRLLFQHDGSRVVCPFPMKALELWFTLQWLSGPVREMIRERQEQAHRNPPAGFDVPTPPEVFNRFNNHYGLPHREELAWTLMLQRHLGALDRTAMFVFLEEAQKHLQQNRIATRYDVFAVYAGLVKGSVITKTNYTFITRMAEYEIIGMVMEDGEEAASAIATAIFLAIKKYLEPEEVK